MDNDTLIAKIADRLTKKKLIVWCGSGISVPAGLPVVKGFVSAILDHTDLSPDEHTRVARAVPSRLPFERLMEVVLEGMDGIARRDFLAVFGAGQPGLHHVFLARLVKKGMLKAIFTTNFDPHLEAALRKEEAGFDWDGEFDVCAEHGTFGELAWPPDRPRIVKLHGTVEDLEKLGTTVARIAAPGSVQNVVGPTRWAFREGTHTGVLAMGYSFSDRFDLSPAIVGCGGPDNQMCVVDLQFTKPGDYPCEVAQNPRKRDSDDDHSDDDDPDDDPHPLSEFENRWHVYGDFSKVIRRLGRILKLGDLPTTEENSDAGLQPEPGRPPQEAKHYESSSPWRRKLDDSFDRLDKKQPGLPRVVLAGNMLTMIGDDEAAVPYLREAAEIAVRGQNETVHLATLQALGGALVRTGDAQEAITVLKQAEDLAEDIDDGRHADHVQALLGTLYQNFGAAYTNTARQHYDRALGTARRRGESEPSLVPHLGGLAASWMRIGDFDAAEQAHRQALAIVEEGGDLYRTAQVYGNMGTMFYMLRDYTEALEWYEKARSMSKLCGDVEQEGIHFMNMGNLFAKKREYDKALKHYRKARSRLRMVLPEGHSTVRTLSLNEREAQRRRDADTDA